MPTWAWAGPAAKIKAEQAAAIYHRFPVAGDLHQRRPGVIVNITASSDVGLDEVDVASSMIHASAHPDVNLIWGVAYDESMQDEMQVTVIATGFDNDKNFDIPAYTFKSPAKSAAAPAPAKGRQKRCRMTTMTTGSSISWKFSAARSSVLHAALQDSASNGAVLCMERVRCVLEVKPWL